MRRIRLNRLATSAVAAAVFVSMAACSSSSDSSSSTSSSGTETTSAAPAVVTPVIASVIAAPIAVPATDKKIHMAYEVMLTNVLPSPTTIKSFKAMAGDRTLFDLSGDKLITWMKVFGAKERGPVIGPGQSAIVWVDATVDTRADIPDTISHAVDIEVAEPSPPLIPQTLVEQVATTKVDKKDPIVIKPPLDGPHWLDGDSCCEVQGHRGAANPINGQLFLAERFAIDYVQLNNDGYLYTGDKTKTESYAYFGTNVHAVADGKVVAVVDNLPEQTPSIGATGLRIDEYGGNHVVQDIGDGHYAFYAHLQGKDGVKVKVGDDLKAGQVVGLLGNSGNSDAPHLHFHVMNGPDPLAANGLPFEIDSFELESRLISNDALGPLIDDHTKAEYAPDVDAGQRTKESPLIRDIMGYKVAN
ncbi:M23 family metallopeptidase [Nocardiaceae bacterium YC2-7]|uniref:M23 family metallopeptidase n=2 Tax=Antrihabitans stalactiti TaxID=2584121 RepID=A0A848KJS6_9NOCA|nr:M23 family metallopeptidase [Antrihabitans stalactiti]